MVKGVDDLIYFLLERISLHSGATYVDIEQYVRKFYSHTENNSTSAPDRQNGSHFIDGISNPPGPAKVDHRLLDKVWQWLIENPEVFVENVAEDQPPQIHIQTTHVNAETSQTWRNTPNKVSQRSETGELSDSQTSKDSVRFHNEPPEIVGSTEIAEAFRHDTRHKDLVLRTTTQRVWQAITGHEVDFSRILKLEFELLCIIAAAGEEGITQPTLIHQSKQDKRSVPKRTDELHRKGYIYKSAIRCPGAYTSRCVLRKLAHPTGKDLEGPRDAQSWSEIAPDELGAIIFRDGAFQKTKFLAAAMEIIKLAGTITTDEFRLRMNIKGRRVERQTADLWLYHMELVGCIQRVLEQPSTPRQKVGPKTLRFVKDADQTAQNAYMKFLGKERQTTWEENQSRSGQQEENLFSAGCAQNASANLFEKNFMTQKPSIGWHTQQALENQVYDIIHESGEKGMSSTDLVRALAGATSYRTIISLLSRLTDIWQESQPPHLRHLAIIRDTALRNGVLSYIYRTFPNFDLAVKAGEASWEAVMDLHENSDVTQIFQSSVPETFDEWGFPKIPESEFLASSGNHKAIQTNSSRTGAAKQIHGATSDNTPNKRRKIMETSESHQSTQNARGKWSKVSYPLKKATKIQTDFEKKMRKRASDLIAHQLSAARDDNDCSNNEDNEHNNQSGSNGPKRKLSDVIGLGPLYLGTEQVSVRDNAPGIESEVTSPKRRRVDAAASHKDMVQDMHRDLVRMSLPGLYINPPQRLPRKKGRPRKRVLVVIKSCRLQDIGWFINSPESERYHHDASATFSPPLTPEQSPNPLAQTSDAVGRRVTMTPSLEPISIDGHVNTLSASKQIPTEDVESRISLSTQLNSHTSTTNSPSNVIRYIGDVVGSPPSIEEEGQTQPSDGHARQQPMQHRNILKGVRLHGGTQERQRSELVMQIVTEAGGLYPGPKELWYPFVTILQKTDSTAKPDPKTVERAVLNLIKSGKLNKLQFAFKASSGLHINKSIVALPGLDGNSDTVQNLEKMIIEHYPEMYLPESLEIGSLLHSRHTNRSIQEKISPNGVDKRMPAPNVGGQLPEYVQRNEEMTIAPEHWEPKDRGDEEYVSEEQRALQSEFPIGGYKHQPDAVPSGRNTAGKKLGKLLILGDSSSDLLTASNHVPSNRHPALLETRIRTTQLRNTITSESLVRQRAARARTGLAQGIGTFEFIAVPETAAAAQQESLREQQYFQEMLSGASGSVNDTFVQVNPQTWIIASAKTHSPEYVSAVTLTDPDQEFNAVSGTFSTSFTVIRKARPKLKVLTNLQCDFENKIPRSLADIICRHPTTCQPARGMEKPVLFNDIVDDVKEWELENSEILESHNSLMIPRFINHVITPHQSTPVAKSSIVSKDFANTTLYSAVLQNNDAERVQLPFQHRRAQRVTTTETSNNTEVSGSISGEVLRESLPRLESSFSRAKTQKRPGRLKARESKLSEDKAKHLIAIIVVVRCLLGGTDRLIKWPIVMQLFPGYSRPTAIKYRWNLLVETNSGYIDEFEKAFVENFVEAYRKGEVEAPDYDKIDNYNWQATIDWAAEHIRIDRNLELRVESRIAPSESNEQVERLSGSNHAIGDRNEQVLGLSVPPIAHTILLEEDRQKFDEHYFLEEGADYFEKSISDILNSLNPNTRRKHAMGELPFVLPLQISKRLNTEKDPTHADIVKSVVRANIIAPSLNYDPDRARARLVPFGEAALNTAIKDLQKAKIIKQENKGRTVPGRNFSMSKYFFDGFRGHWEIAILTAAVGYKHLLEHKFATDGYAEFSPHATQGQVLSILNLKLMGLIEVEFERPSITADPTKSTIDSASGERLISIWGFTEGDYKTTHVNTRNFVLPPRISPTASWIQDVPLPEPYPQPPAPHLPGSSTTGNGQIEKRIPLWYDIHDRIIPDVWELVVASVINTIALSPGTGAKDIVVLCKRMIEEWEVELVLKWMEEMGIAKRTTAGGDRFEPKEWWWYILGCNVATRPYG